MKKIIYLLLAGLFYADFAYAQEYTRYEELASLEKSYKSETVDSLKVKIVNELIDIADEHNHIPEMLKYIDWLESLAIKMNHSDLMVTVRYLKARVYFGRYYKMDTSLIFLREAMVIMDTSNAIAEPVKSRMNFWNLIGLIHKNKSDFDSAIYYYKKILSVPEGSKQAKFYATYNISNTYTMVGNDELALKYAHENYELAEKWNVDYLSTSKSLLGRKYYAQGLYEQSIEMYDGVIEWLSQEYIRYERTIISTYELKAGALRELDRHREVEVLSQKVLSYYARIYGEDHIKNVTSHIMLGGSKMAQGQIEEGLHHFDLAKQIAEANNHMELYYQVFGSLAKSWYLIGEYDKSLENLRVAIEPVDTRLRRTGMNEQIGDNYMGKEEYLKASEHYNLSIILFQDSIPVLSTENISPSWINADRISKLGNAHEKLSEKENDKTNLELAYGYYYLADSVISNIKGLYKQQDKEIDLSLLFQDLYAGGTRVSLKLFDLTQDESFMSSAFYFSEKSKSSVLLSSTIQLRPDYMGLPDSLLERENDLKSKIEYYQNKLARQSDKKEKAEWYDMLLTEYKTDHENLIYSLEQDYPEYYRLRFNENYLSVTEVRDQLSNDETMVSFSFTDENLIAFVVDANQSKHLALELPDGIDSLIYNFNQSLKNRFSEDYVKYGKQLYDILYRPINEHVKTTQLIIVPDGILWYVNFDLLISSEAQRKFLFQDKAIIYSNSANQFIRLKGRDNIEKECLAFSYTGEDDLVDGQTIDLSLVRDSQGDLPGTLAEIKSISNILTGDYLYGDEATETNFKKLAGDYSILHLALHGEINDATPVNSKLFFAKSDADTLEDSYLHAFELYGMDLNADMVVLSACNTGVGQLVGGEGIMSLGRAFQYAGTNSVLLSNWEVVDGVAPELMTSFYTYLKDGKSKSEALRRAKMDFLENADVLKSHPYYWGTFTLMGNNTPIVSKWYKQYLIHMLLGVVVLVILTVRIKKVRASAA